MRIARRTVLRGGYVPAGEPTLYHIDTVCNYLASREEGCFNVYGYHDIVTIKGWAVDHPAQKPAKAVYVEIGGKLFKALYDLPRFDVANSLNAAEYQRCGFSVSVKKADLQNNSVEVSLRILRKGSPEYFQTPPYAVNFLGYQPWIENREADIVCPSGITPGKNEVISQLEQVVSEKDKRIQDLENSISWKATLPLRFFVDALLLARRAMKPQTLRNGIKVLREEGPASFISKTGNMLLGREMLNGQGLANEYHRFLMKSHPTHDRIKKIKQDCLTFSWKPKISVITPVHNTDPRWLKRCIQSVVAQYYENWELCLYDDASGKKETINSLKKWLNKDKRIKIGFGKENRHISVASNEAISMATGDFIALLDHDDELSPDALYEAVKSLNENPALELMYSDEDKIDPDGQRSDPYFKPGFSPDLLLSNNYMCHFVVMKKSLGDSIGWFRKGFEGAQDHDLLLRAMEKTKPENIHHIPKVIYHWRKTEGSTATDHSRKDYAAEKGRKSVQEYLDRNKISGTVEKGNWDGSYRIIRKIVRPEKVSIIIPFKDQVQLLETCVSSILQKTDYLNYELLLVNNQSEKEETLSYLKAIKAKHPGIVRLLNYSYPFNFSRINNWAIEQAEGNFLLLLNNDTEVIRNDWLSSLVEHIQRDEIGAVGAQLLYPNDSIQHGGVVLGIGGVAGHAYKHIPHNRYGHHNTMGLIRNVSACTAACLMTKKTVYREVGGMEEQALTVAFNDVDFCLKIRQAGYLIIYTPYALLYHHESVSRGFEDTKAKQQRFRSEVEYMLNKWDRVLKSDPYYNPNLSLEKEDFSISLS